MSRAGGLAAVHTEESSPIQSSMKAKAGLNLQTYDTSTDDRVALFNEMKIMTQMGN